MPLTRDIIDISNSARSSTRYGKLLPKTIRLDSNLGCRRGPQQHLIRKLNPLARSREMSPSTLLAFLSSPRQ